VKVIEAPSDCWDKQVSCSECRAKLEIELSDLKRIYGFDQRDDSSWDYVTFVCPCCGRGNSPKGLIERIPLHLRNKIKT
jgi:hypothetical protein